ncbi:MAG TPA: HNH endonuclease signature motif containing protein [Ktedonobacteraceae bacterium]|nr:HNH endonuclease signature motif containing protein [Ktedonobacteraceae bacterium]
MTERKRAKFGADVLRVLRSRSKDKCECCGLDIIIDRHHIWEFARGGPDVASNILCLCPSCHRVLPKLLSEEDQRFIQTLNFKKRSTLFDFYSNKSTFEIGNVLYKKWKYILILDSKPVIYPYQLNGRFYVNIVMLQNFNPYLLVIANRVIYGSDNVTLTSTDDGLRIIRENKLIIEIERSNGRIKITLDFKYIGESFVFNDEGSRYPGNLGISNLTLEGDNQSAAVSWNTALGYLMASL